MTRANLSLRYSNEGISVTNFCSQVAALFPGMFFNLNLVNNHKIVKNSTTTKAREKISTDLESLEFQIFSCMFD